MRAVDEEDGDEKHGKKRVQRDGGSCRSLVSILGLI